MTIMKLMRGALPLFIIYLFQVINEPSGIEYPTIENPDNEDSSIDNIDTDYSAVIEYPTIDNSAADNLKITLPEPSPRNVEKNCTEIR